MNEYYPKYLETTNNSICVRCKNTIIIDTRLSCSYLNECKKCQNMGTYGYNTNYYSQHGILPQTVYQSCECKTIYIYKKIYTCINCIKCDKCSNKMSYIELNNINKIEDKHLCKNCQ